MSSIDLFSKYKELLSNLNTSIDIIQNDGRSVYVSLWKNDENLSHNINQLKQQSEKLSSTCTKVGLINPNTMPLNGLQSLLDEVLVGGQSVFQCYSIIASSPISPPLREMLTHFVQTEFKELLNFLEAVSSGRFEESKSSIGLVWDANKAIQNLPLTNKAAYRRGFMETMTVIRETEKEFQASLQTSKEALANLNTEKQTEHDEDDDFDDFGDIEEDNYTAEDILIVEPSLQILNCTFRFLKELLNLITEWSESPLLQTDQISPISPSESTFPLQYGVSLLYHHVTSMKNIIVDIGVELYTTPIEIMKLQSKVNELFGKYETIFQEIDRIENSSGSEEKNILRRQVVSVIRNSLHSIDIEARLANTSMRIGPS